MLLKLLQSRFGLTVEAPKNLITSEELVMVERLEQIVQDSVKFADEEVQKLLKDVYNQRYNKPKVYFNRIKDGANIFVVEIGKRKQALSVSSLSLVARFSVVLDWMNSDFKFSIAALTFHEYGHILQNQLGLYGLMSNSDMEKQSDYVSGILFSLYVKKNNISVKTEDLENFWLLLGAEVKFTLKDGYSIDHTIEKSEKGHAISSERFSFFVKGFSEGNLHGFSLLVGEISKIKNNKV
jgi:hypothetical protein